MYDNDLFNGMFSKYTTTEDEQQTINETSTAQEQQTFSPYTQQDYYGDYSTNQNYEEESSYNSIVREPQFEQQQTQVLRQMDTPTIIQQEQPVNLIKKREKMVISPRLKVAAVVFSMIFALIVFASIWNFAMIGKLQASFAGKEFEINQLEQSIKDLNVAYKELDSSNLEGNLGYVEKVDGVNSFTLSMDDYYVEPEIEKLPSNWFNDVCEFFSQMFA